MSDHILIVDDEKKIAQLLADYLHANQFTTTMLHDGDSVEDWVRKNQPALILLDLMLPGKDGLEVCRAIRAFSDVPIIMVTARIEEIDRIVGLEIGADDYVCKPFSPREVVARVKGVLRRSHATTNNVNLPTSDFQLDRDKYQAWLNGNELDLTPAEFRLLDILSSHVGKVFSRQHLIEHLYDDHRIVTDRTIDSHVKNLRKKVVKAGGEPESIRSVYGVGYKWE